MQYDPYPTAYFQHLYNTLLTTGGTYEEPPVATVSPKGRTGIFEARLRFGNGYLLSIELTVDLRDLYPSWVMYSLHLQDNQDRCVFRYDNAPHHPHLRTFPHHVHRGPAETPYESSVPHIRQIIVEVLQIIGP